MPDPATPRRRRSDRADLPVPVDAPAKPQGGRARRTFADFAAHLFGQEGRRRGLRGGQETLDAARESYLKTEYSGEADRRPPPGLITRKKV